MGEIECHCCAAVLQDEDVTKEDMAATAYAHGWRYGRLSDYEECFPVCPSCQRDYTFREKR